MNTTTKILFTDLDGTLLNSDKEISEPNLAAIRKMTEAGHKFVISTGRPLFSALEIAKKYEFIAPGFFIVSFNGGLIYDCYRDENVFTATVPFPLMNLIFDEAKSSGIHVHTYSDHYVLAEKETPMLIHYSKVIKIPYKIVPDVMDELLHEPCKVLVADLENHMKLEAFREKLDSEVSYALNSVFSNPMLLEYGPKAATKGNAIINLCQYFDIPVSNSIACGDEENDLTMIQTAGIGVAMNNATEHIKSHSDYITKNDNNHHGIKEVIEQFIID